MKMLEDLRLSYFCLKGIENVAINCKKQVIRAQAIYQEEYISTIESLQKIANEFLREWIVAKQIPFSCALSKKGGISLHIDQECMSLHIRAFPDSVMTLEKLHPCDIEESYFSELGNDLLCQFVQNDISIKSIDIVMRKCRTFSC